MEARGLASQTAVMKRKSPHSLVQNGRLLSSLLQRCVYEASLLLRCDGILCPGRSLRLHPDGGRDPAPSGGRMGQTDCLRDAVHPLQEDHTQGSQVTQVRSCDCHVTTSPSSLTNCVVGIK